MPRPRSVRWRRTSGRGWRRTATSRSWESRRTRLLASFGPPSAKVGIWPYTPPLTAPPSTSWWLPHAWSLPLPLGCNVRPNSDCVNAVTCSVKASWRPSVTDEHLRVAADGRVVLRLRRPWADGTTSLVFEPVALLARLAVLVPRPRINLVLYTRRPGAAGHVARRSRASPGACRPRHHERFGDTGPCAVAVRPRVGFAMGRPDAPGVWLRRAGVPALRRAASVDRAPRRVGGDPAHLAPPRPPHRRAPGAARPRAAPKRRRGVTIRRPGRSRGALLHNAVGTRKAGGVPATPYAALARAISCARPCQMSIPSVANPTSLHCVRGQGRITAIPSTSEPSLISPIVSTGHGVALSHGDTSPASPARRWRSAPAPVSESASPSPARRISSCHPPR